MMRLPIIALPLLLAACSVEERAATPENSGEAGKLDEQAVAVGILPDPENLGLAGQFETRSDLGVDKFCAVKSGSDFDIGVLAVFGPQSKCEAQGNAKIAGEKVEIKLQGEESCSFKADYDGIELRFPGVLEKGCESYCSPRASFSGTSYFIITPGDEAARRTLGRDIDRLCE